MNDTVQEINIAALVPVENQQIGEGEVNAVNARDLHGFLEVGKDFSSWIKDRISAYGFTEDRDFVAFDVAPQKRGVGNRGAKKEYALTLDMAKELSMVERNERGKEARRYFIECERRAKSMDPVQALNDPETMRGLLLSYSEKVLALQEQNSQMKPQVEAYERIAVADGSLCVTDAAKQLQMRPKDLFDYLSQSGWIYRREGNKSWIGYQAKIQQGVLEHKITVTIQPDGDERINTQVRVTPKGLTRLSLLLNPGIKGAA